MRANSHGKGCHTSVWLPDEKYTDRYMQTQYITSAINLVSQRRKKKKTQHMWQDALYIGQSQSQCFPGYVDMMVFTLLCPSVGRIATI